MARLSRFQNGSNDEEFSQQVELFWDQVTWSANILYKRDPSVVENYILSLVDIPSKEAILILSEHPLIVAAELARVQSVEESDWLAFDKQFGNRNQHEDYGRVIKDYRSRVANDQLFEVRVITDQVFYEKVAFRNSNGAFPESLMLGVILGSAAGYFVDQLAKTLFHAIYTITPVAERISQWWKGIGGDVVSIGALTTVLIYGLVMSFVIVQFLRMHEKLLRAQKALTEEEFGSASARFFRSHVHKR